MLRISFPEAGPQILILRLEGRIAGPWVTELQNICQRFLDEGRVPTLDCAEVSFIDSSGVRLITKLRAQGISLVNCSPFIEEQLKGSGTAAYGPGPALQVGSDR